MPFESKSSSTSGFGLPGFVTPAFLLRPYIAKAIDRIDAEEASSANGLHHNGKQGGRQRVAEWTSQFYKKSNVESLQRKVYVVMKGEQEAVNIDVAECMLMGIGLMIEDTDLPTLPGNKNSAIESVDAWCEAKGEAMSLPDRKRLASTMANLCRGLLYSDHICANIEAEMTAGMEAATA